MLCFLLKCGPGTLVIHHPHAFDQDDICGDQKPVFHRFVQVAVVDRAEDFFLRLHLPDLLAERFGTEGLGPAFETSQVVGLPFVDRLVGVKPCVGLMKAVEA